MQNPKHEHLLLDPDNNKNIFVAFKSTFYWRKYKVINCTVTLASGGLSDLLVASFDDNGPFENKLLPMIEFDL